MFLLGLIIYQVIISSAKIINFPKDNDFDNDNGISASEDLQKNETHVETWDDTLWVLKLNDLELNFTYLRSATESEEEYFDRELGPMLHRYPMVYLNYKRRQESLRVKKDDPMKSSPFYKMFKNIKLNRENDNRGRINEVKCKIIQIINKFVLSFHKILNTNLPETMEAYDIPTLTLYFKGPFTALLVNYERTVWQFFIKPPSPLPEWLYNEHNNNIFNKKGMYAVIPEDVKEEFYEKLLQLLQKMFGFPL